MQHFYTKLQFVLYDVRNIPVAVIETLHNEQIELGGDMHLTQLSNRMPITPPPTPEESTAKYISQFGSLLSPQDIGHYQLNNHDKFMKFVIEHWQKTDGIIQDTAVITPNEVNQNFENS